MYCRELENKTTLFITEPRAGHTHPAISCFTEIKLIGLSIILKNIDGLKKNKKQNYTKELLQKYLRNVSVLSEVFKKKYFSIQTYFIRSICYCLLSSRNDLEIQRKPPVSWPGPFASCCPLPQEPRESAGPSSGECPQLHRSHITERLHDLRRRKHPSNLV